MSKSCFTVWKICIIIASAIDCPGPQKIHIINCTLFSEKVITAQWTDNHTHELTVGRIWRFWWKYAIVHNHGDDFSQQSFWGREWNQNSCLMFSIFWARIVKDKNLSGWKRCLSAINTATVCWWQKMEWGWFCFLCHSMQWTESPQSLDTTDDS